MLQRRIGNDIRIMWRIMLPSGQYIDFDTVSDMVVEVRHSRSNKRYPQQFQLQETDGVKDTIVFGFTAAEQQQTGVYDLFVSCRRMDPSIEGGIATMTRDKCKAFELVEKDCQLTLTDQVVHVVTVIEKGDPGITPHIGPNGNWWIGEEDQGVRATGNAVINVVSQLPESGNSGEFYATFDD